MKTIMYTTSKRQFGKGQINHLHLLVEAIHNHSRLKESITLIIEPGDMTRYELLLVNGYIILGSPHQSMFCPCISIADMYPIAQQEYHDLNICTEGILKEVLNIIQTGETGVFYDWEDAQPRICTGDLV